MGDLVLISVVGEESFSRLTSEGSDVLLRGHIDVIEDRHVAIGAEELQLIELVYRHEPVFLSDCLAVQSDRVQCEEFKRFLLKVVSHNQVFLRTVERICQ